jgi:hypothetical protein
MQVSDATGDATGGKDPLTFATVLYNAHILVLAASSASPYRKES